MISETNLARSLNGSLTVNFIKCRLFVSPAIHCLSGIHINNRQCLRWLNYKITAAL